MPKHASNKSYKGSFGKDLKAGKNLRLRNAIERYGIQLQPKKNFKACNHQKVQRVACKTFSSTQKATPIGLSQFNEVLGVTVMRTVWWNKLLFENGTFQLIYCYQYKLTALLRYFVEDSICYHDQNTSQNVSTWTWVCYYLHDYVTIYMVSPNKPRPSVAAWTLFLQQLSTAAPSRWPFPSEAKLHEENVILFGETIYAYTDIYIYMWILFAWKLRFSPDLKKKLSVRSMTFFPILKEAKI